MTRGLFDHIHHLAGVAGGAADLQTAAVQLLHTVKNAVLQFTVTIEHSEQSRLKVVINRLRIAFFRRPSPTLCPACFDRGHRQHGADMLNFEFAHRRPRLFERHINACLAESLNER